MTARRLLALLLCVLILSPSLAVADLAVVNGAYTHALRGTDVGGAFIQDINLADSVTGSRLTISGGAIGVNILSSAVGAGGTASGIGNTYPTIATAAGAKDTGNNLAPLRLSAAGNLNINIAEGAAVGGTASTVGAAVPGLGTYVLFKDSAGVNAQPGNLDAGGNVKVVLGTGANVAGAFTQSGAWNVGQTGTWTVQPGNTPNTSPWLVKPHDGSAALFGAAGALADATANPTVGGIASYAMCFNGATWDRCKGGTTDTEDASIARGQASVSLVVPFRYYNDGNAWVRSELLTSRTLSAASTNATNVKASRGLLKAIRGSNTDTVDYYVGTFNTAGTPTCTNTPKEEFLLPKSSSGVIVLNDDPVIYDTGIAFCLYTTIGGTGSVAANKAILNLLYQ